MDPDLTLDRMLGAIQAWEQAPRGSAAEFSAAEAATSAAAALDHHLRSGGKLPTAWKGAS
jgi:hypothetical protein